MKSVMRRAERVSEEIREQRWESRREQISSDPWIPAGLKKILLDRTLMDTAQLAEELEYGLSYLRILRSGRYDGSSEDTSTLTHPDPKIFPEPDQRGRTVLWERGRAVEFFLQTGRSSWDPKARRVRRMGLPQYAGRPATRVGAGIGCPNCRCATCRP